MLHHRLPILISRIAMFGRHAVGFCHQLVRAVELNFVRFRDSRRRIAWRRAGASRSPGAITKSRRRLPLLIHYHIFKNAGTSFEWALERGLGKGFRSFDTPSPKGFISARDLAEFSARHPEVRAISSHQAAPPAPRIRGREVFTSILIRDPIARLRSIYLFERRQEATSPGALKAKELNFKEYVEWRLKVSPAMLCNFQVHFCSRTVQKRAGVPGQQQLDEAIVNLDSISVVGTVARYDEWLALAQKILSGFFPNVTLSASRRNATVSDDPSEAAILEELISQLGDATAQYLLENNQLDMCLHQIADSLLTRRLAEHGVGLALHQAYISAQRGRRLAGAQIPTL